MIKDIHVEKDTGDILAHVYTEDEDRSRLLVLFPDEAEAIAEKLLKAAKTSRKQWAARIKNCEAGERGAN